jgi:hypothetical protein
MLLSYSKQNYFPLKKRLILFMVIFGSDSRTGRKNMWCEQTLEFFNIKACAAFSSHSGFTT